MAITAPKKPAQFSIPAAELDELAKLAEKEGVTRSELVRHALDVYKFLRDKIDAGGEVQIKLNGETLHLVRL